MSRPETPPVESATTPYLVWVDLGATLVFAVEGALAARFADLDLFGVLVLSFATALGGGIVRDVLIGAVPPNALRDVRYPLTAFFGGTLVVLFSPPLTATSNLWLLGLDAAGLSLFAVAGTQKALDRGLPALSAALLGAITGAGGGTLRDVFLARIPLVLRADVYATAACFGAFVLIVCRRRGASLRTSALAGAMACFVLRMVSVWRGWELRL